MATYDNGDTFLSGPSDHGHGEGPLARTVVGPHHDLVLGVFSQGPQPQLLQGPGAHGGLTVRVGPRRTVLSEAQLVALDGPVALVRGRGLEVSKTGL